ncbi:MAG: hypothetical protein HDQ44_04900 [Desulfovibrio sp.]|nr:hypothetical protein [Desulfovibrio sp.]
MMSFCSGRGLASRPTAATRIGLATLALAGLLAGCAGESAPRPENPGVEDINPGQQSIITSPGSSQGEQARIPEKNI